MPPPTIYYICRVGTFNKSEGKRKTERERVFYWFRHGGMVEVEPGFTESDLDILALVDANDIAAFPKKRFQS